MPGRRLWVKTTPPRGDPPEPRDVSPEKEVKQEAEGACKGDAEALGCKSQEAPEAEQRAEQPPAGPQQSLKRETSDGDGDGNGRSPDPSPFQRPTALRTPARTADAVTSPRCSKRRVHFADGGATGEASPAPSTPRNAPRAAPAPGTPRNAPRAAPAPGAAAPAPGADARNAAAPAPGAARNAAAPAPAAASSGSGAAVPTKPDPSQTGPPKDTASADAMAAADKTASEEAGVIEMTAAERHAKWMQMDPAQHAQN